MKPKNVKIRRKFRKAIKLIVTILYNMSTVYELI